MAVVCSFPTKPVKENYQLAYLVCFFMLPYIFIFLHVKTAEQNYCPSKRKLNGRYFLLILQFILAQALHMNAFLWARSEDERV